MAEFNRNKNGVFGEIKLNGNSSETESTSFFESTIAGNDIFGVNNQNNEQKNNANNIFAGFETETSQLDLCTTEYRTGFPDRSQQRTAGWKKSGL